MFCFFYQSTADEPRITELPITELHMNPESTAKRNTAYMKLAYMKLDVPVRVSWAPIALFSV